MNIFKNIWFISIWRDKSAFFFYIYINIYEIIHKYICNISKIQQKNNNNNNNNNLDNIRSVKLNKYYKIKRKTNKYNN